MHAWLLHVIKLYVGLELNTDLYLADTYSVFSFQLLSYLLKRKTRLLNNRILQLIFSLVGTAELGFESSVIKNYSAFQYVLCNFEVQLFMLLCGFGCIKDGCNVCVLCFFTLWAPRSAGALLRVCSSGLELELQLPAWAGTSQCLQAALQKHSKFMVFSSPNSYNCFSDAATVLTAQ